MNRKDIDSMFKDYVNGEEVSPFHLKLMAILKLMEHFYDIPKVDDFDF